MKDFDDLYSAKAVFKGFRGQTLYILSRIIYDKGNFIYRPEGMEDLDIYFEEELVELVQVKYYKENLTLSHVENLFERSVEKFRQGLKPKISVVSFGPIGPELENGFKIDGDDRARIKSKLIKKGYTDDEVDLIFEYIEFTSVEDDELKEEIFDYLKTNHLGFDPDNAFNLLMNWIYQISEKAKSIDKSCLMGRLNNVADFLSERYNFIEQYGLTVKPIKPTEKINNLGKLEEEFYEGISARYEHILAGLDVIRPQKLDEIRDKLEDDNTIIIHGASGQGKSTLAYRFLHEFYPEALIYQVISKKRDALKIIKTLHAISKSIDDKIAIYLEIEPGDTVWPYIVKELYRYEKFHVFVTIREEDWTRTTLSGDIIPSEVELTLNKKEAEYIYKRLTKRKPDKQFLDFEDSWSKFGGQGPLLEFTYLITQGSTLKEKLTGQITRIREESAEMELDFLRIVSIIGMFGGKTDLKSVRSEIELKDPVHVINLFQKEYFIRQSENGRYLEPLHPIRSKILVEILSDEYLQPLKEDVTICISVIDEKDLEIFILNCLLGYGYETEILESLAQFTPTTWTGYGLIIKSLLWLGIHKYIEINDSVIQEAHEKFSSGWSIALITDLSGASEEKIDLMDSELISTESKEVSRSLREKLCDKTVIYDFLENWLSNSGIPDQKLKEDTDLAHAGFSMFWISRLGIDKELDFSYLNLDKVLDSVSLESIIDFVLGLYYFDPVNTIMEVRPKILDRFKEEFLVPLVEDDGERLTLHCIMDFIEFERSKGSANFAHDRIMERINLIRKLYPDRKHFASKSYGHKISFIELEDDTNKDIPVKNLPLNWLTDINSTFMGLVDYNYRPETWEEYVASTIKIRIDSVNLIKKLIKNFKKYYKSRKNIDISKFFGFKNLGADWGHLVEEMEVKPFPKVAVDPWGFSTESNWESIHNKTDRKFLEAFNLKKFKQYIKDCREFVNDYNVFLKQGPDLIKIRAQNKKIRITEDYLEKYGYRTNLQSFLVIYMYFTYEKLIEFQRDYRIHFHKYGQLDKLEKDEIFYYGILTELWRVFALNEFKLEKDVEKKAVEIFENQKRNIRSEVLAIISETDLDVSLISLNMNHAEDNFFVVNINSLFEMDETLAKIFNILKKELADVLETDLKKLFLDLNFKNFRIILLVKNKLLFPFSFNYPLFRALNSEDKEINVLDFSPKQLGDELENLPIENWLDYIPEIAEIQKELKFEELYQLVYHLKQLKDLELDELGLKIAQDYTDKISGRIQEDFQTVSEFLIFTLKKIQEFIQELEETEKTSSANIISEKKQILDLVQETHEYLLPEKPIGSGEIEFKVKLSSIDNWCNRLEKSRVGLIHLYCYFADQMIAEYEKGVI